MKLSAVKLLPTCALLILALSSFATVQPPSAHPASFGKALLDAEEIVKTFPAWGILRVSGTSMVPYLDGNSLILYAPTRPHQIEPGMLAIFHDRDGDIVVHQVVSNLDGIIQTKGTRNFSIDPDKITAANLIGTVTAVFHTAGSPDESIFLGDGRLLRTALGKSR